MKDLNQAYYAHHWNSCYGTFIGMKKFSLALCLALIATNVAASGNAPVQRHTGQSFGRAAQLLALCDSNYPDEVARCEGFITGVAAVLMDAQVTTEQICLKPGTNITELVDKVKRFLRTEKFDDLNASAVSNVTPVLITYYSCSGKPFQKP